MVDALKRASAESVNVVMPYYGYARQDRKARAREPITAKLVANMLEVAGVDRLLTIDLHAAQIQGFFDIPVDHLMGAPLIADYFERRGMVGSDYVVVSPDHGGVTRARKLAEFLKTSIAIIDKRRSVDKMNTSEVMNIIGKVEGKTCILIDDMIDTAGTICMRQMLLQKLVLLKYMQAVRTQFFLVLLWTISKNQLLRNWLFWIPSICQKSV